MSSKTRNRTTTPTTGCDEKTGPILLKSTSWMDPRAGVIALGPAGGKSTLSEAVETSKTDATSSVVIDSECFISWRKHKSDFNYYHNQQKEEDGSSDEQEDAGSKKTRVDDSTITNPTYFRARTANWENEIDMSSLFFRGIVPVTMVSLVLGKISALNCIDSINIVLAGRFIHGLAQIMNTNDNKNNAGQAMAGESGNNVKTTVVGECAPSVCVLRVESSAELDRRIAQRTSATDASFVNVHFSYAWHRQCHLLWQGVAVEYGLPLLYAPFVPQPAAPTSNPLAKEVEEGSEKKNSAPQQQHPPFHPVQSLVKRAADPKAQMRRINEQLLSPQGGHHVVRFESSIPSSSNSGVGTHASPSASSSTATTTRYTLLEVLPLQWALLKERQCFEGEEEEKGSEETTSVGAAAGDHSKGVLVEDLELISWFHAEFVAPGLKSKENRPLPTTAPKKDDKRTTEDPIVPFREGIVEMMQKSDEVPEHYHPIGRQPIKDSADGGGEYTLLVQSPYITREWGRESGPFRALALIDRKVVAVTPGIPTTSPNTNTSSSDAPGPPSPAVVSFPMLQQGPAGYQSPFLPTYHLSGKDLGYASTVASLEGSSRGNQNGSTTIDVGSRSTTRTLCAPPVRAKMTSNIKQQRPHQQAPALTSGGGGGARPRCVILYHGSFAPFHAGHKETLVVARKEMKHRGWDVLGAYLVPVAALWPKDTPLGGLAPWALRAAVCQMCVADLGMHNGDEVGENSDSTSFKVAIDHAQGSPNVCVESLLQRVQAHFPPPDGGTSDSSEDPPVSVCWVNGTDIGVTSYMEWLLKNAPNVTLLWVPRAPASNTLSSLTLEGTTTSAAAGGGEGRSLSTRPPPVEENEDVASLIKQLEDVEKKHGGAEYYRRGGGAEVESSDVAVQARDRALISTTYLPKLGLSSTQVRRAIAEKHFSLAAEMIGNDAAAAYTFWAVHEVDDMGRTLPL